MAHPSIKFKTIHRITAFLLGTFILSHLTVHLFALIGPDAHTAALKFVQNAYRNPIAETVLVLAILVQIFTGVKRLKSKRPTSWAKAQVFSGLYLLAFLLFHTSAALYTHHIYGLETDFYWSAGSLHFHPIKYAFGLYYFLAVLSIFVHFASALHFSKLRPAPGITYSVSGAGALIASLIILGFSGALYPIEITEGATKYYETYFELFGVGQK